MHILYLYYENIMNILLIFYNHNYKILYYISSMCIYSLLNNYIYIYIYIIIVKIVFFIIINRSIQYKVSDRYYSNTNF